MLKKAEEKVEKGIIWELFNSLKSMNAKQVMFTTTEIKIQKLKLKLFKAKQIML